MIDVAFGSGRSARLAMAAVLLISMVVVGGSLLEPGVAGAVQRVTAAEINADPEAFEWLSAYSPLHNVGDPTGYPPILITTAETDDRVVPMHSHKFTAELQHAAGGSSDQPLLERIDRRAGHGLGKPVSKLIDESADIYGFLLHHLS